MISLGLYLLLGITERSEAADVSNVKVDSFVSIGHGVSAAEICGHLEGSVKSAQILIVTDPRSKGPGKYIALTTPQGEFCAVVGTATGQADVSIVRSGAPPNSVSINDTMNRK